ncbi:hypothetical protein TGP89_243460 [Toxoplasma gondii p89]|uniref:Uncharacterized protein n=1 Tax=Toxoplasma gondii p89 TaxID=943119 RepID=A0A086JQ50_TOXGO|nr:hypothetical protein TGP89_243460 [Toxoplasma gondii p89]
MFVCVEAPQYSSATACVCTQFRFRESRPGRGKMTDPLSSEPKELLESAAAASSLLSSSPLSLSRALPAPHSLSVAMEAPSSASMAPPALSADDRGDKTSLASMSPTAASLASPKSNSVFLSLQVSSTSSASTAVPQDECDSAASREDGSPRTPWALDASGATPKSVSKGFGPEDLLQASSGETASPVRRARGGRREGLGPEGDEAKKSISPRHSEETERKASAEDESFEALVSTKKMEDCASLGGRVSDSEDPESPCTKELNGNTGPSARAERSSRKAALRRIRQFTGVSGKDAATFGSVSSPGDAASATTLEIESLGQDFRSAAERDFLAVKDEENPRRKRVRTEVVPGGSEPASPTALEEGDAKAFRQTLLGRDAEAQKPGDDPLSSVLADAFLADRDGKAAESNRTTPSVLGDAELRPEVDFARGLAAVAAEIASAQGLGGRCDGDSERSRLLSLASALGKAEGQFVGDRVSEPRDGANSAATQELGPGSLPGDLLEEGRRLLSSPAGLSMWLECASNASSSLSKRPNEGLPADLVALSASLMHEEASNGTPTPRVLGLRGPAGFPDTEESPSHLHGAALDAFGLQLGSEGLAARSAGLLGAFAGEKAPRQQKVRSGQKNGDRTQASRPHALSRGLVTSAPSSAGTTPSSYGASLVPHSSSMTSVMVKSVSPAGVVRRGGRNRRKRTKYDLAYRQMEQLGPFAEEAKHVDLSKVSGSSFAVELLKNPHLYSYESWVHGFAWPVGADGRRLLLRKLRGVYWSDPDYWQKRLMAEGLYRRDLFTLATVQELFKVTHLMGADVWDFLLKCTALTHKCDALTAKEGGQSDNEEVLQNASSPEAASPHAGPEVTSQALAQVANLGGHGEAFAWASGPQGPSNDLLVAGAAQEECDKAEQASVVEDSEALSSVYPPPFHHSASLELGETAAPPSPFSGPRLSTGGVISSFESSAEGICAALSLRRPSSGGDREPGLEGEEERPNPVAGPSWLGAEALQELLAGSLNRQERGTSDELMQEEETPHAAGRQGLFLPPGVLGTAASEQRANGVGLEKRARGRPRKPRSNLGSLAALREELGLDLAQKGVGPDAADPFGLPGAGGLSNGADAADGNGGELLGAQTGAQGYSQFSGSSAAVSALNLLKTEEFSGFGAPGVSERGDLSQTGEKEAINLKRDEFLSSRFLGEGNLQQAHLASSVGAPGKLHARGDSGQELGAHASKRPRLFEGAAPQEGGQLSDLSRLLEEELDVANSAQARGADMDSLRSLMLQVAEAAAAADIGPGASVRRALERSGACGGGNGPDGVATGPGEARRRSGAGQGLDFLTEQSGDRDGTASGAMEEEMRQIEILLKALDHHLAESQEQRDERQVERGLASVGKSEERKDAPLENFSLSPMSPHMGARGAENQLDSGMQSPRAGRSSGVQETETGGSPVVAGGDGDSQAREGGNGAVADAKALLECVQALASASPVGSLFSTGALPQADFAASLLFQQKDRKVGVSSAEEARERRAGEAAKTGGLEIEIGCAGGVDGAGEANETEAWGREAKNEGGQAQTLQLKEKRETSGLEALRGPGSLVLKLRSLPARANSNAAVAAAAASSAAMAGSLLWGRDRCGASAGLRRGGDEEARQSALSFLGTLPGIAGVGRKRESGEKKSSERPKFSACSGAAVLAPALFPSEANPQQPLGSRGFSEALGSLLSGGAPEGGTAAGGVSSSRLLEALSSDTHALLQLTAHYSFMAQFMQCAMLFEVQQALLRVIASFRAQERRGRAQSRLPPDNCEQGEKRSREDADESEGPGTDSTMKACLQSLLESGTVHMQFVQLMAQQLRRHVLASGGESRGGEPASETETRRPRDPGCGAACGGDEERGEGEQKPETETTGEVEAPPGVAGRVAGVLEEEEEPEKALTAGDESRQQSEEQKDEKKSEERKVDEEENERREGSDGDEEGKNELDESSEGTLEGETVVEARRAAGSAERRRELVTQEDSKTSPDEEKEMRETTDEETAKQEDSREECL